MLLTLPHTNWSFVFVFPVVPDDTCCLRPFGLLELVIMT